MTGRGTAALAEGGRVDFGRLRGSRRQRLFAAMEAAGLDLLVLGQGTNIVYATGYRPLWTSGSRPFAPACLVFRADERIHLLATWDEGVPADIDRSRLFGLSWNPSIAAERLGAVAGLGEARRIGADGTSAGLRSLLAQHAPDAKIVDARQVLLDARATKTADEIACIETACALAESGLEAMAQVCRPGVTERHLLGALAAHLGSVGVPIIQNEAVASVTRAAGFGGPDQVATDRVIGSGDAVALSPTAHYAGYEGTIARTVAVGEGVSGTAVSARCRESLDAVIARCEPGATGAALLETWRQAGGAELAVPLACGVGLGPEPPLIGLGVGAETVLHVGQTLTVQGWMHDGTVGWLTRDVLVVEPSGPRVLTRSRRP